MRYLDCVYWRGRKGNVKTVESTSGKQAILACPDCVYSERA